MFYFFFFFPLRCKIESDSSVICNKKKLKFRHSGTKEIMTTNLMNPVKLRFYKERYEKESKLTSVRETFTPTIRTKSLTGKFYAKHDVIPSWDIRKDDLDLIKRQEMTAKDIYSFRPPTFNME